MDFVSDSLCDSPSENSITSELSSVSKYSINTDTVCDDINSNVSYDSKFLNSIRIPGDEKKLNQNKKTEDINIVKKRVNRDKNISDNVIINMCSQLDDTIYVFKRIKKITDDYIKCHNKNISSFIHKINKELTSRIRSKTGNGAPLIRSIKKYESDTQKYYITYKLNNGIWIKNRFICEIDNIDIVGDINCSPKIYFGSKKYLITNENDMMCFIEKINKNTLVLNNSILYLRSIK